MSVRRWHQTYSTVQATGTNGRPACLQCGGDIVAKRRSTFCGAKCAEAFRLKTSAAHVRHVVFERDKGVCAVCGKDVFEDAQYRNGSARTRRARGSGDLWQADHITPVVEGGGECGIDNYRTLCTACHKVATKELHGRLSAKRRAQRLAPLKAPLQFGDSGQIAALRASR